MLLSKQSRRVLLGDQPVGKLIASMYGIFTYIYHNNQPNVGKYTIHGWCGQWMAVFHRTSR